MCIRDSHFPHVFHSFLLCSNLFISLYIYFFVLLRCASLTLCSICCRYPPRIQLSSFVRIQAQIMFPNLYISYSNDPCNFCNSFSDTSSLQFGFSVFSTHDLWISSKGQQIDINIFMFVFHLISYLCINYLCIVYYKCSDSS